LCSLQWVCSLLSGDIILLKINPHEISRNHYLWITNVQKEGQIHPKRPPDVTSCSTELGPGPGEVMHALRHNVTMAKNCVSSDIDCKIYKDSINICNFFFFFFFFKHVFEWSKFGQLCTAVCTNTYCISGGFRSLKWPV
jgi:hypothetical protein